LADRVPQKLTAKQAVLLGGYADGKMMAEDLAIRGDSQNIILKTQGKKSKRRSKHELAV
jgi:hypothetical protein